MTVKTIADPGFTHMAGLAQKHVAELVAHMIDVTPPAQKEAVLSGAMAGMAQVVWEARAKKDLNAALEFWTYCGESYIKQFYAEDVMGAPEGSQQ